MTWLDQEVHRKYHPLASLFPLMEGQDFDEFKADIAAHGLREAIWLHPDSSVIDGRNRHRACIETETQPRFRTWGGTGSLVAFIVSMNLHRRHLTSSQRAAIALDALPMLEEEARKRQATSTGGAAPQLTERFQEAGKGTAAEQAAQLFNTNPHYVHDAKKLQEEAPDLLEGVRVGEYTIPKAKRELRKRQRAAMPRPEPPAGKYAVIYADPPWQYDNTGFNESAESQYPTMPIDDICALPIGELATDSTVLFLWATNPLLPEALRTLKAWGFEYKTNIAWIKDRGRGKGWWLRSKHELLLIGVKRNTPHPKMRPDSCFEAERGPVHSRKPAQVYGMIEAMFDGPYIELFARSRRETWEAWGNEL